MLRTVFASRNGQPVQVIQPARAVQLPLVDLQALLLAQRESAAQIATEQDAQRKFDLEQGPLFHATLLRLAPSDHVLLFTMHHIISDGWSAGVLVRELSVLYAACLAGEASPLKPLPIQYADYAVWQRETLLGAPLQRQDRLLAEQASWGLAPRASDGPAPATYPDVPRSYGEFALDDTLSTQLRQLSRSKNVTFFMTMLASFQAMLARYTGQTDIAVGRPIANRRKTELQGLIGFFVNTLVLRTRAGRESTV